MERVLLFVGMVLLLWGTFRLLRRWQIRHVKRVAARDPLLDALRPVPTVVYFTSPHCPPCSRQQKPILDALQKALGENVQIVEVDVGENPAAADRWKVLSVPTTFVLDAQGVPRAVNYGVARLPTLERQIREAAEGRSLPKERLARGGHVGTP